METPPTTTGSFRERASMKALFSRLWRRVEDRLFMRRHLAPVYNVSNVPDPSGRRRALLVYLTYPFHIRSNHPSFRNHQNLRQAVLIASVLGEVGYVVDVVHWQDGSFEADHPYDLVISHRIDFTGVESAFGERTIKIYLASGMNHVVRNENFRKRLESLAKRRGCRLSQIVWDVEEMPFLKIADALVGFGNKYTMAAWERNFHGPTYSFENFGVCGAEKVNKDWEDARKRFLFFGSTQQLGKGLDLLLEVFAKHSGVDLYICSRYEKEHDFCACYAKELFKTPNIHACGWVDIAGPRFRELISRCAYVIHPSCSDACPGSISNAVSAGLVPIVTRETGFDTNDFGFMLRDDSLGTIEQTVMTVSNLPVDAVAERSRKAREAGRTRLSEDAFRRRWLEMMSAIHAQFLTALDVS